MIASQFGHSYGSLVSGVAFNWMQVRTYLNIYVKLRYLIAFLKGAQYTQKRHQIIALCALKIMHIAHQEYTKHENDVFFVVFF